MLAAPDFIPSQKRCWVYWFGIDKYGRHCSLVVAEEIPSYFFPGGIRHGYFLPAYANLGDF